MKMFSYTKKLYEVIVVNNYLINKYVQANWRIQLETRGIVSLKMSMIELHVDITNFISF